MKTTAKDFKAFQGYCRKWRKQLGLTGYSLSFEHKEWEDDEDQVLAWVQSEPESGAATVCLNTKWPERVPKTLKILESTAMHEMAEVLLCQIRELLLPYYSDKLVNTHIHKVIRPLENLLFE